MKYFFFLVLAWSLQGFSQEVGVKVDASKEQENTTIEIRKGSNSSSSGNKKKYEISEGTETVSGDGNVLQKEAKTNWKKACDEWKKETKENNKENKMISMSCGTMTCIKEGVESVCKSTASYKVRVLVEE